MEFIIECKAQLMCLIILAYIGYQFVKEGNRLNAISGDRKCNHYFDRLFICASVAIVFDAITAYLANRADTVSPIVNGFFHYMFYSSYVMFTMFFFNYWVSLSGTEYKSKLHRVGLNIPWIAALTISAIFMPKVYYVKGTYLGYSLGIPAVISFGTAILYVGMSVIFFLRHTRYVTVNERTSLTMTLLAVFVVLIIQVIFHEILITSLTIMLSIISVYLGMENPTVKAVNQYHEEMLMGYATMLDCKDGGTGGHIRRTSEYAVLIARELSKNPKYAKKIDKDYLDQLRMAAPMHDIGKISIPDSILQKPGKLTDEEFEIMKTHSAEGARIIRESFKHLEDGSEKSMPYLVALNHHEKWNGRGYPNGIAGTDIPLCARIMAVADVFDAVSAKRCYRDAMPLGQCFNIIKEGRGRDFDPDVVDAFLAIENQIIAVYESLKE